MITHYRFSIGITLLFFLLLSMTGCTDNPVTPGEELEAVGLVLLDGENEIVRAENGVVTGQLEIAVGTLSPLYTLKFIDEGGDLFTIDEEDHTPGGTIADETVVLIERDSPGDWNFRIRGVKEGGTTLRLSIVHGSHDDFTSPDIPIVVTP